MEALASFQNDAEAPVAGIAGLLLSKAAENPRIPQLLTREVLLPGGEMQHYFTTHMAPHLGGVLPLLLAREKSSGRLREEFDPAIAALLAQLVEGAVGEIALALDHLLQCLQ